MTLNKSSNVRLSPTMGCSYVKTNTVSFVQVFACWCIIFWQFCRRGGRSKFWKLSNFVFCLVGLPALVVAFHEWPSQPRFLIICQSLSFSLYFPCDLPIVLLFITSRFSHLFTFHGSSPWDLPIFLLFNTFHFSSVLSPSSCFLIIWQSLCFSPASDNLSGILHCLICSPLKKPG